MLSRNRVHGVRGVVLAGAVAGLGTCAVWAYVWWSYRGDVPRVDGLAVLTLLAIGAAAGLASGRARDSLASWAAGLLGAVIAYLANYAIDPNWPRADTPFEVNLVLAAGLLLATVGGGHLLGAWVARRALRGPMAGRSG